jgi:hypothetical protein
MSELPAVSTTVTFSSEIPGRTVILRAKRATDRASHIRYVEKSIGGGVFPGQSSDYPYMRFRVSTLEGGPILRAGKYASVLVTAHNWPSDITFPFPDETIAEKAQENLTSYANALAAA